MNIGIFDFTGLGTDPEGACCGMRPLIDSIVGQQLKGQHVVSVFHGWDEADSPDTLCRMVLDAMLGGNEGGGFDKLIFLGHSFGGAFVKFFLNWLAAYHPTAPKIDLALFFDPAPNGFRFDQWAMWQIADADDGSRWKLAPSVKRAVCFYQHNEQLLRVIGICGVPFCETSAAQLGIELVNIDCSDYGVGHVSIITDPHVQQRVRDEIAALVNTASTDGSTPLPPVRKSGATKKARKARTVSVPRQG